MKYGAPVSAVLTQWGIIAHHTRGKEDRMTSTTITAERYHDISCGHRVVGHEGKCKTLHGHNYRVHFVVGAPALDQLGRVLDFTAIKERLCMWIEGSWDHRLLIWEKDPMLAGLEKLDPSVVITPFNPTAENMAYYLLKTIGPRQLVDTGITLMEVRVEETRKCTATAKLD